MTTACLLAFEDYSASGVAECDLKVIVMSRELSNTLLVGSNQFREFDFSAFAKRIADHFATVAELAFQRLDVRLANKLLEMMQEDGVVFTAHQYPAVELGTAREVVSRQLRNSGAIHSLSLKP